MISSPTVLSYHRTYRSVYGGSIVLVHCLVFRGYISISTKFEAVVCNGGRKNPASRSVPVTLSGICPPPSITVACPKLNKVSADFMTVGYLLCR